METPKSEYTKFISIIVTIIGYSYFRVKTVYFPNKKNGRHTNEVFQTNYLIDIDIYLFKKKAES